MLRASRLLATSGGMTTIRAAAATTSRAATTATKRISATERVATSARWRGTLDAVARTARAQAGSSVATSARWRRTLHHMARTPMLPACALATITLARPPSNCEVAVAVPPKKTMPPKNWRVARTLGGWSLRVFPVALWAPFALLIPFLRKWWWRHVLYAIEGCGPTAVKLAQWSATRPDVFPEAWCVPASPNHRRLDGVEADAMIQQSRGDRVGGVGGGRSLKEHNTPSQPRKTQVPTLRAPAEPRDARDADATGGPADARRRVSRR